MKPGSVAAVGLAGLASGMGIGRFAFTPLLPLMQAEGRLDLAQGASLASANYLGYLVGALACLAFAPSPSRAARHGLVAVAALTLAMAAAHGTGAWLALRFAAGVSSAFVLVGVSGWVLAVQPSASARVFAGVGVGIAAAGAVGMATALSGAASPHAWLLLGCGALAVAASAWRPLAQQAGVAHPPATPSAAASKRLPPLGTAGWRLVLCYGAFGYGYILPATFLPAMARLRYADPALFGWAWPVFGLAAAGSVLAAGRWLAGRSPVRVWAGGQLVMAAGVLAPALSTSLAALLASALCVGGTFMVVTMAAMQQARQAAGAGEAPRWIAAMTAAFALGQLVGPLTVTAGAAPLGASIAAAAVLVVAALALPRR